MIIYVVMYNAFCENREQISWKVALVTMERMHGINYLKLKKLIIRQTNLGLHSIALNKDVACILTFIHCKILHLEDACNV